MPDIDYQKLDALEDWEKLGYTADQPEKAAQYGDAALKTIEVALFGLYTISLARRYGPGTVQFLRKMWFRGVKNFKSFKRFNAFISTALKSRNFTRIVHGFAAAKGWSIKQWNKIFRGSAAYKSSTAVALGKTGRIAGVTKSSKIISATGKGSRFMRVGKTVLRRVVPWLEVAMWATWLYDLISPSESETMEDDDNMEFAMPSDYMEELTEAQLLPAEEFSVAGSVLSVMSNRFDNLISGTPGAKGEHMRTIASILNMINLRMDDEKSRHHVGFATAAAGLCMMRDTHFAIDAERFSTHTIPENDEVVAKLDNIMSVMSMLMTELCEPIGFYDAASDDYKGESLDISGNRGLQLAGGSIHDTDDVRI